MSTPSTSPGSRLPNPGSRILRYAEAMAEALDEILSEDERVTLIGAGFAGLTPSQAALNPVREKYAARIKWPPISELAYSGIGVGAAMVGMRPIVEISTATFSYEAIPQSGSPQPWYWNTPGLQVAMPGSPADVKGLLRWAVLKSRNPTVFLDHQKLMELPGPVPEGPYENPFGLAEVKRQGS